MRINKYLALCGAASRRGAEQYIKDGRVAVNGKTVTGLAVDIDENADVVTLDGKPLSPPREFTYLMLHKPKGCVCTNKDEKGRKTVFDIIGGGSRLFTEGRLDYDTEGLLLITDDGALCKKLTHPSGEIPKTYIARIKGSISPKELNELRKGVTLDDGFKTSDCSVKVLSREEDHTRLEITIHEGHNRQIKRMLAAVGKEVVFLKRIKIGELTLGGLKRGAYRSLTKSEIDYLIYGI
jgi:23S rRNA pseudouridine2605 synthase